MGSGISLILSLLGQRYAWFAQEESSFDVEASREQEGPYSHINFVSLWELGVH